MRNILLHFQSYKYLKYTRGFKKVLDYRHKTYRICGRLRFVCKVEHKWNNSMQFIRAKDLYTMKKKCFCARLHTLQ